MDHNETRLAPFSQHLAGQGGRAKIMTAIRNIFGSLWLAVTGILSIVSLFFDITDRMSQVQDLGHSKEIWLKAIAWLLKTPWWVTAALFVAMTIFIYWPNMKRRPTKAEQKAIAEPKCHIIFGSGSPFQTVEACGVNRRQYARIKLQNDTKSEMSNLRVSVENLDPAEHGISSCELKSNITIGAGAHHFVDVAYYDIGSSDAEKGKHI